MFLVSCSRLDQVAKIESCYSYKPLTSHTHQNKTIEAKGFYNKTKNKACKTTDATTNINRLHDLEGYASTWQIQDIAKAVYNSLRDDSSYNAQIMVMTVSRSKCVKDNSC